MNKVIAIIGLGYVGLPLAVEFGKKRKTIGFDINISRINQLKKYIDKTLEITSEELKNAQYLNYSSDIAILKSADIFIITVPTPVDNNNIPDLSPLESASKMVASIMKKDSIIIYESTVYPGCTEEFCVPILEKYSGFKFNKDFFCGYSPERINPGDKVNTLTKIKKITSGSTIKIANEIDALYSSIIKAGTYKASSMKVAEAAKVIENTQRDLNIALINELSVLFERLSIDTLEVLEAAGTKWNFLPFRPGMVGGHCIGVDPYYLTFKAEQVGYHPQIIAAGRRLNDSMAKYAARNVIKLMSSNGINIAQSRVGVLGLTFKENCPDIRNTKIINLINELNSWGIKTFVSDPFADIAEVKQIYNLELLPIDKLRSLDAIIIAVGHSEYKKIALNKLKEKFRIKKPILADLKSIFDKNEAEKKGFVVFRL